eukprot:Clim_evm25s159 gene=Clim_evmTU25s159
MAAAECLMADTAGLGSLSEVRNAFSDTSIAESAKEQRRTTAANTVIPTGAYDDLDIPTHGEDIFRRDSESLRRIRNGKPKILSLEVSEEHLDAKGLKPCQKAGHVEPGDGENSLTGKCASTSRDTTQGRISPLGMSNSYQRIATWMQAIGLGTDARMGGGRRSLTHSLVELVRGGTRAESPKKQNAFSGDHLGRIRMTYRGDMDESGMRQGYGVFCDVGSESYAGRWQNGLPHGHGVQTTQKAHQYLGAYVAGLRQGYGVRVLDNDEIVKGDFVGGHLTGYGCMVTEYDIYSGQWKQGQAFGLGTYICRDDSYYMGEYVCSKRHGNGIASRPNGDRYLGQWKDGRRHGLGRLITKTASGTKKVYVGQFERNRRHGCGMEISPSGDKIIGIWQDGRFYSVLEDGQSQIHRSIVERADALTTWIGNQFQQSVVLAYLQGQESALRADDAMRKAEESASKAANAARRDPTNGETTVGMFEVTTSKPVLPFRLDSDFFFNASRVGIVIIVCYIMTMIAQAVREGREHKYAEANEHGAEL